MIAEALIFLWKCGKEWTITLDMQDALSLYDLDTIPVDLTIDGKQVSIGITYRQNRYFYDNWAKGKGYKIVYLSNSTLDRIRTITLPADLRIEVGNSVTICYPSVLNLKN